MLTLDSLKSKNAPRHMVRWFECHIGASSSYDAALAVMVSKHEERLASWLMSNFGNRERTWEIDGSISPTLLMFDGSIKCIGDIKARRIIVLGDIYCESIDVDYLKCGGTLFSNQGKSSGDIICKGIRCIDFDVGGSLTCSENINAERGLSVYNDLLTGGHVMSEGSIIIGGTLKSAGCVKPGKKHCIMTGTRKDIHTMDLDIHNFSMS